MSSDSEAGDSDLASVGRARSLLAKASLSIGTILAGAIVTLFRESILQNIRNIPLVTYGFIIIGLGVAALLYFIIPLTWDIENIHSDVDALRTDTRLLKKNIKALETNELTDTDDDDSDDVRTDGGFITTLSNQKLLLASTISGTIAGASIGLIGGLPGAAAGALFGISIGYVVGSQMLKRQETTGTMDRVEPDSIPSAGLPQTRHLSDFKAALISSDGETFFVSGERSTINRIDTQFVEAYVPVYLPWRASRDIVSIPLSTTRTGSRQMGDETLYYGRRIFSDPEGQHESEIEFDFREYPKGTFDIFEMSVTGRIEVPVHEDFEEEVLSIVDTEQASGEGGRS